MSSISLKKNAVYNAIKTVSTIVFPMITFPYISRVLLPDNVGKVNFGSSIVSYFSLIATLGMATYAVRECAKVKSNKEKLSKLSSELFSISVCTTVVAYVLLAITLIAFRRFDNYRTLIIIQSFTIILTTLAADWLNSAMEDFRYITLRTVFFQVIAIVAMFIFVRKPEDYIKYAAITLISSGGAGIINIWYRRRFCKVRFTLDMKFLKHIGPIFAFFAMTLSSTIFANADTTMLGFICGDYQVGIYSTAHRISRVISQLVQSIATVLLPRLSEYFVHDDFDNANKLLRKLLNFNITLGFPCVVGVIMVATDAVTVFAGEDYAEAASVLRIMILCFMFSLVGGSFLGNGILLPMGREKYYMIVCLITAVCNVILNAIFIPFFQANAAAATTVFNGFLIFVLLLFKVDKRIHIQEIGKIFLSPAIGCTGIVAVCIFCKSIENIYIRLMLSVIASGVVYMGIMLLMKNEIIYEALGALKKKFMLLRRK